MGGSMRHLICLLLLFSLAFSFMAVAAETIDGVPFRCVNSIRYTLIKNFAERNKADKEAIESYKDFIREAPVYTCRDRKNPNLEYISWCDGSGCTGATGKYSKGKCTVYDEWSGQDDQDYIDPEESVKDCLMKDDFKKNAK